MQRNETQKEVLGLTRITKKRILELCRKDKLYQTPELNDVLYLHYQGFDRIECLEDYTELKCLWLECNAISEIQGLDRQTKLKCLFLQSNLISKIENLEYCKELDTLNLSQNHIRKIENCGLEVLPVLNTLNLASNYLKDCEGLKELEKCKNLSVLDLSNNRIDDILVVKIFSQMPELKVLVLQGNPVVSKIPQYRKTLTLECKKLTYLDSRPVFPKDRACAEAWKRGGYQEERKENERWNRRERKKMRDSVNATIHLRNKHRKLADQISLIPSSDSEDDTKEEKIRIRVDSETDTMDDIWNEVTGNKSDGSSNNSKQSESEQSSEGSNGEEIIDYMIDNKGKIDIIEDDIVGEDEKMEVSDNSENQFTSGLETNTTESKRDDTQATNPKDIDADQQENYKTTIMAIEKITKVEDHSKSLFKEHKGRFEEEEEIEDNYEPLKELDETMKLLSQKIAYDQGSCQIATKTVRPSRELTVEQEFLKVNNQLRSDFEELSTNMGSFVNQLEQEQEERQEVIKVLFSKETAATESSCESSENENVETLEKLELERTIDQWDKVTKRKNGNIENKDQQIEVKENSTYKLLDNQNDRNHSVMKYIPMDISPLTQKSNEALKSLERESKKLKMLLQKLEDNNEEIFKDISFEEKNKDESTVTGKGGDGDNLINENYKIFDKNNPIDFKGANKNKFPYNNSNIQEEIYLEKCAKTDEEENPKEIVEQILNEILKSLEMIKPQRIPCEFPHDITDNDEESNLTSPEVVSKSIPDVINSFNYFLNEIAIKQKTKNKTSLENRKQKSLILKELSKQSISKYFNTDTAESLEGIRKNQHKKVRRVVERVYAKKDQYKDTLELVNGKLMVRNENTKELQELPQSRQNKSSDSEEDYDTAQSEDDESKIKENTRNKPLQQRSFKPATRKARDDLIVKALVDNKSSTSNDDSDENPDEFYSLDCQDKPYLYDIDKEFLHKLTLEFPNSKEIDENHIVQCARSYGELKHYLTPNKEKDSLTKQEQEILDNMIKHEHVRINENPKTLSEYLQNNSDLSQQEQLWLNKVAPKAQGPIGQINESTCNDNSQTNSFLRDILEQNASDESLNEKISRNTIFTVEHTSEEEKNEIEMNIDFASGDENAKEKFKLNEELEEVLTKDYTSLEVNVEQSAKIKPSADVEILECNLEIISDNVQIVDTVTVNAELHF